MPAQTIKRGNVIIVVEMINQNKTRSNSFIPKRTFENKNSTLQKKLKKLTLLILLFYFLFYFIKITILKFHFKHDKSYIFLTILHLNILNFYLQTY